MKHAYKSTWLQNEQVLITIGGTYVWLSSILVVDSVVFLTETICPRCYWTYPSRTTAQSIGRGTGGKDRYIEDHSRAGIVTGADGILWNPLDPAQCPKSDGAICCIWSIWQKLLTICGRCVKTVKFPKFLLKLFWRFIKYFLNGRTKMCWHFLLPLWCIMKR